VGFFNRSSHTKGETMTMKWKKDGFVLAAAAALALGLSGCSDDDSSGSSGSGSGSGSTQATRVTGSITSNTTWTANNTYLLSGAVFVRSGATLTIEAGTRIVGEKSSTGTLVIDRGARIMAQGTETQPIVFTSDRPNGSRARGDWGGLIINGNAPLNVPGGQKEGEGDTGVFGGNNPSDSSGVLRYVRVEFAGIEFSPDNELNGIAFQGTGAGTACDHLQVHYNLDDGFEWFGGNAACKYLVATGAGDDSFDWTDGWTGRGQFWVAQQKGDDADSGFESDNLAGAVDAAPRSAPTIFNVTLVGAPSTADGAQSANGMVLRAGTGGMLRNFIVLGFKQRGVDVRDRSVALAQDGTLSFANAIVHGNGGGAFGGYTSWANVSQDNPMLGDPYSLAAPNWQPAAGGPARNGAVSVATPPNDGFFESANFVGAIGATDWTRAGWVTAVQN
jgi:hypothetical protein